ncbi:HAMP domain-containing protein [Acinetobacter qingfengensis]|uniref:histidine kinase n=1 Tax=Acinetobacter qingfengensis TaxID=1262585 RepID=A0A1E7QYZ6_9GAMM|nr:ATP-binding protein [Acinetobacter qingfengensis]KAA8733131.1 HAMP domain-containing protein [Acinetobacter qingfengensis]OEY92280.1 two-component sensor histidine kinase [Acinetobacter qingfengensis]
MPKDHLPPISPQNLLDEQLAYQEVKRTSWEKFLDKIKPRSAALRTTLLVSIVVLFSLWMSLWFFWRTLYLPEMKQHARYLAVEIEMLSYKDVHILYNNQSLNLHSWLDDRLGLQVVTDPDEFPTVRDKFIAELFTDRIEQTLATELKIDPNDVHVYFQFKPSPRLWIKIPQFPNAWLRESLHAYANYSPELILGWLLGIPLLTMISILTLVRQLNRPLKRLQDAANTYSKTGKAPFLETKHGPLEIRQVNLSFNHMIHTLQQIEQERRIMLAGISHDLRTPLTRIRLTAEMLPDEFLKEGLIYDVDDMDAILNQFISFMRDGSDEELQDTDLNSLLQEVIIQFKPLDIQFERQELPKIQARTLSLKRLVGNLVNNAKRYGAEPIELSAHQLNDHEIVIRVADHGEGIPESQVDALMQPFVRGEAARTIQGSGLGLAIVKRIVDIHQGRIEICNHQAGGLEVKIYLPISGKIIAEEN